MSELIAQPQSPLADGSRVAHDPESPRLTPSTSPDISVLLILMTFAMVVGAILHRQQVAYGVNDGSRLNTVYYLLQYGTYEYLPETRPWSIRSDTLAVGPDDPINRPVLRTIDMICVDGKFYSSKPPLYPTCLAGIAWLTQKIGFVTMYDKPRVIVRTLIIVGQVLPLMICLILLRRHIYQITESPFARNVSMLVACMGTYLTPWVNTINNHVPAAAVSMIALDAFLRIWYEGRREWYWFAIAGFFAALTATFELPAGLLAVAMFVILLTLHAPRTLMFGLIAAAIPTAAALYLNHVVTGQLVPAYEQVDTQGGFYDYPGSYWGRRKGVDALNEPWYVYLMHMTIGHEGFFSLSPILLVALAGMILQIRRRGDRWQFAVLVLSLTVAVMGTYVYKTRNYGGGCMGFRWLFWILPMWLLFLPYGVKLMTHSFIRQICLYACLAISFFSVSFAWDNPWKRPWLRILLREWDWINY